ncbi:growth-regulating factor 9 isoform X2 [Euphorbia lathyris]
MMDPEQDGCRRTDGKKWRCRKDVVPGQKYCERHMHRGRRCSRKPVESFQTITTSNATPTSKNFENSVTNSASATIPIDTSMYLKNSGVTSSSNVDFKIMGTNMTPNVVSCPKSIGTSMIQKGTLGLINAAAIMTTRTAHTDSTVTIAAIEAEKGGNNNYYKSSGNDDRNRTCSKYVDSKNQIDIGNDYGNIKNANVVTSQRLNFSPNSVLQVVGFSKEFDCTMDPEPDGCRRTDGKKWRCRKDVVPGQKYCEKHMHRGRFRSRKPVESFQTITTSNATPTSKNLGNSNTNSLYSASATIPSYHKNSSVTSSSNVDFKIMGTNMTPSVVSCAKSIGTSMIRKGTLGLINAAAIMTTSTVHTDSTVTTATIEAEKGDNNNYYKSSSVNNRNGNCGKYVGVKNQIDRGNDCRNITNANVGTSQRLNFSPKSVLQVQGCNSGCLQRSGEELEPRRCRRTDGKKWRCRRDVVPDEKYCKMHMHRGAKKRVLAYQSPPFPQAAPQTATSSEPSPIAVFPSNVGTSNLNTNLSISITANPHPRTKDDTNTSGDSSSSDTISDTIIANCDYREVTS